MEKSLSILFYLRRVRSSKDGLTPIYLRITVSGQRADLSTDRKIMSDSWDSKSSQAKGSSQGARILNNHLNSLKENIYKQYNLMQSLGEPINVDTLKAKVTGKGEKKRTLIDLFETYNKQIKASIGKGYAAGTYSHYETTLSKLRKFMKKQYNVSEIKLADIKHKFIVDFDFFLRTSEDLKNNTAVKYLKILKKIVKYAYVNEWIDKYPFHDFQCSYKDGNRGYLTMEEVDNIAQKEMPNEKLSIIRDMFIFQIYTGFAYTDMKNLTPDNLSIGIDGNYWIVTSRAKTKQRSSVPLLPRALEVVRKYENYPLCLAEGTLLPGLSNHKYNDYLKEIATSCEITKNLTSHLGRHTFATTITLTNGVPIESVSAMLGHRSIRTTQIYSKVIDTKVSEDMHNLSQRLLANNKPKYKQTASS
jgi:site-specific recombinase XerD